MKIKHRNNKTAQSTIVYLAIIAVVAAAFTAIGGKIRQKLEGSYKKSADVFDEGRQLGTFSTSTLPKFVFPVLPGGSPVVVPPVVPVEPPDCLALLNSLAEDAKNKQQAATDLEKEAEDAMSAALQMKAEVAAAESEYRNAQLEADAARQEADAARAAADAAQADCNNCSPSGPLGPLVCQNVCDYAAQLAGIAAQKEAIAVEKQRIADEKYQIWQDKLTEYNRLNTLASAKMQAASQAQADAVAAAQKLQEAQKACYGL